MWSQDVNLGLTPLSTPALGISDVLSTELCGHRASWPPEAPLRPVWGQRWSALLGCPVLWEGCASAWKFLVYLRLKPASPYKCPLTGPNSGQYGHGDQVCLPTLWLLSPFSALPLDFGVPFKG